MYMNQNLAVAAPAEDRLEAAFAALARLYEGQPLAAAEAENLFDALVAGELPEPSIAAMLIALRFKGESAEEMRGAPVSRRISISAS